MNQDRRLLTYAILGAQAAMAVTSMLPPVFAGWLEGYFGIQKTALGLLFTVGSVGGAVAGLVAGWVADRYGRRLTLAASLGCMTLGYAGCGVATSYLPFMAASLLAGLGAGGFAVVGAAALCAAYPTQTRRVMGQFQLAAAAGFCAGPVLLNVLLEAARARATDGWAPSFHLPFVVVGAALAVAALVVGRGGRRAESDGSGAETGDVLQPLSPWPRLATAAVLLLAALHAGEATMSYWFVRYCEARFSPAVFPPAWGLSIYGAAFVVGRIILSTRAEGVGQFRWLIVPGLVGGTLYLGVILAPGQLAATVALALAGVLISMEYPTLMGLAARVWPEHSATMLGAAGLTNLGATVLYSTLVGAMLDRGVALQTAMLLPGVSILSFGVTAALWARASRLISPRA